MLPYLAQGANSAVEDGAVLGLLLGHMRTKFELPKALRMYQQLRKARGDAIVRETFKQRESFHMPDGPAQQARDQVFLSQLGTPLKGAFPSRWTCPEVQPWLYGYDAFEEVQRAVQADPFGVVVSREEQVICRKDSVIGETALENHQGLLITERPQPAAVGILV
jgi:salicylate hydroxylase